MHLSLIVLSALILAGCATRPVADAETTPVPADRVLDATLMQERPGTGTVVIKRDSGVAGSVCSVRLFVDAKPVAELRMSEKVSLYLDEGEHILSAWPNRLCGGSTAEVSTTVKPASVQRYRIGYGSAGDFYLSATAF